MGKAASEPRWCREPGCDTRIILARRAFTGSWMAFEANDRPPFSDEAAGAYVLVAGQVYRLPEFLEDIQMRWEISETKAREHAEGHPWHRAHIHDVDPTSGQQPTRPSTTTTKETNHR